MEKAATVSAITPSDEQRFCEQLLKGRGHDTAAT
jgi:hypothetical protein